MHLRGARCQQSARLTEGSIKPQETHRYLCRRRASLIKAGARNGEPKPRSCVPLLSYRHQPCDSTVPFPTLQPCQESFGDCSNPQKQDMDFKILPDDSLPYFQLDPFCFHGNSSVPSSFPPSKFISVQNSLKTQFYLKYSTFTIPQH